MSGGYPGREGQAAPRSSKQHACHLSLRSPSLPQNPSRGPHDGHSNRSASDCRPATWPCGRNARGARARR